MNDQGKKSDLLNNLLILILFNTLIGKFFYNDEDRYEGEFKDGKKHGQGKTNNLLSDLLILTLFNIFIGKYFYNDGTRYEGEWKDDKKHGQGKKKLFIE